MPQARLIRQEDWEREQRKKQKEEEARLEEMRLQKEKRLQEKRERREKRYSRLGIGEQGRKKQKEEYENPEESQVMLGAMFWLRCIVAITLFGCVVLADYNDVSYNGITSETVQEALQDRSVLETAKAFLAKYIQ